jgi:hypothetical protein
LNLYLLIFREYASYDDFGFFYNFPMGYMSLMISQCYPVGFGYILLLPNEEDSIDSVLVCNPSGKEIPALA